MQVRAATRVIGMFGGPDLDGGSQGTRERSDRPSEAGGNPSCAFSRPFPWLDPWIRCAVLGAPPAGVPCGASGGG